jgi:UDPglucose 6-dehydrogenase
MKISVIGTGYVGLVTGTCFAEMGNEVICVDIDQHKIDNLKNGIIPIYEPGLEEMVKSNRQRKSLLFSTNAEEAIRKTDICFIAVGTPMGEDGSADLKYVLSVAGDIGKYMDHPMIVVDKSTVPVGTADRVKAAIEKELSLRHLKIEFHVVSNPEFLKEGTAIHDFMYPDRIVVGADNADVMQTMREIYKPFMKSHERFIGMDIKSSEMTKYAANAMLAVKISFINEMSHICERVGADINMVRIGIGSDSRIGYSFIYPGCGYGGSCFPKDVQALIKTADEHGYTARVLQSVEEVNNDQKKVMVNKAVKKYGENLSGKIFAVWGLSFKPETDDMREASSIEIINGLTALGALVQAYDPKARHEAENFYLKENNKVTYCDTKYDALKNADALFLVTEWKEFRSPDFDEIKKLLKAPVIFDGRNQYDPDLMKSLGFTYFAIGR